MQKKSGAPYLVRSEIAPIPPTIKNSYSSKTFMNSYMADSQRDSVNGNFMNSNSIFAQSQHDLSMRKQTPDVGNRIKIESESVRTDQTRA
jgi:hypothetical protein